MKHHNIDLAPDHLHFLVTTLTEHLPKNSKIWLFGSRATGTAKPFSDIDILIDAERPLSLKELAILSLIFEESSLPYKVDLVDAASISPSFRKNIESQLILLDHTEKPSR